MASQHRAAAVALSAAQALAGLAATNHTESLSEASAPMQGSSLVERKPVPPQAEAPKVDLANGIAALADGIRAGKDPQRDETLKDLAAKLFKQSKSDFESGQIGSVELRAIEFLTTDGSTFLKELRTLREKPETALDFLSNLSVDRRLALVVWFNNPLIRPSSLGPAFPEYFATHQSGTPTERFADTNKLLETTFGAKISAAARQLVEAVKHSALGTAAGTSESNERAFAALHALSAVLDDAKSSKAGEAQSILAFKWSCCALLAADPATAAPQTFDKFLGEFGKSKYIGSVSFTNQEGVKRSGTELVDSILVGSLSYWPPSSSARSLADASR